MADHNHRNAQYLAAHIHEAPVWIVPCLEGGRPTRTSGSSIYPAVQNMLLVARALGLGATLTTLYLQFEKEAEAALGLPPDVHSYALLPIVSHIWWGVTTSPVEKILRCPVCR